MRYLRLALLCVLAVGLVAYGCSRDKPTELSNQSPNLAGPSFSVLAVYTETLGEIDVPLPDASGMVCNGIGLRGDPAVTQPGYISLNVPGTPVKAFIFWEGQMSTDDPGDPSILVNDQVVNGTFIGGTTDIVPDVWTSTYRADITSLVVAGANNIKVEGMDFNARCPDCRNDGAGVLVLYDDGSGTAHIDIREGNDYAFYNNPDPVKQVTVPQTFTFAAADEPRNAHLCLFTGSVSHNRPNVITVTIGGGAPVDYIDLMGTTNGDDWDSVELNPVIPAGVTSLTVEAKSEKGPGSVLTDIPASLVWVTAGLAIEPLPEEPPAGCRVTGGLVDESDNCVNCPYGSSGLNKFTAGGQAGANTAIEIPPSGNWTHSNKKGPAGKFVFHAGTPSAPEGTEISWIECMDPDNCDPARDAPAKQIDFGGIGVFKSTQNVPDIIKNNVTKGKSLHYFEVNIDDLGEPGKSGRQDPPTEMCPADGFGVNGSEEFADCDCPDFYRIVIWSKAYKGGDSEIIYEASGYIKGGNFQIHPLTGYDQH
jgi:hypothetical protein